MRKYIAIIIASLALFTGQAHAQRCLPKMQGIEVRADMADGFNLGGKDGGYSFGAALSTVVFQYTTAEPEKKKLQAIQDAAVQAVQENYQDEPHVEAQVAMLIANQAADNDNKVTVEQVRRQLAEEYPLAAVPFDDYVEKSDVLEPAQAQQPVTVSPARIRRMESRSIHTASGIEVKIPTEILSEDSAVEFLHAEDGSVSLLIKNVIL